MEIEILLRGDGWNEKQFCIGRQLNERRNEVDFRRVVKSKDRKSLDMCHCAPIFLRVVAQCGTTIMNEVA